jgi:hypothetical protein
MDGGWMVPMMMMTMMVMVTMIALEEEIKDLNEQLKKKDTVVRYSLVTI